MSNEGQETPGQDFLWQAGELFKQVELVGVSVGQQWRAGLRGPVSYQGLLGMQQVYAAYRLAASRYFGNVRSELVASGETSQQLHLMLLLMGKKRASEINRAIGLLSDQDVIEANRRVSIYEIVGITYDPAKVYDSWADFYNGLEGMGEIDRPFRAAELALQDQSAAEYLAFEDINQHRHPDQPFLAPVAGDTLNQ